MSGVVSEFVDVAGGHLYYEQEGAGPDVVFVNGGLSDLRMWDSTVSWLADTARVTRWDCRDTGLSSWSTEPYDEMEDLAAVFDAAGITRATVVGVSDGGRRALAFAHRYPERVDRVCVIGGSFGEFPDPSAEEARAREPMLSFFARIRELLAAGDVLAAATLDVDSWCPALTESDRRRMIGWELANAHVLLMEHSYGVELDPPIKTRFAELTVPIAVLTGGRDFMGTQLWARRLAGQAPDASLLVLPEADHFAMLSAPDDFRRYLAEAITGVETGVGGS